MWCVCNRIISMILMGFKSIEYHFIYFYCIYDKREDCIRSEYTPNILISIILVGVSHCQLQDGCTSPISVTVNYILSLLGYQRFIFHVRYVLWLTETDDSPTWCTNKRHHNLMLTCMSPSQFSEFEKCYKPLRYVLLGFIPANTQSV